jgi:hypothetical protein
MIGSDGRLENRSRAGRGVEKRQALSPLFALAALRCGLEGAGDGIIRTRNDDIFLCNQPSIGASATHFIYWRTSCYGTGFI